MGSLEYSDGLRRVELIERLRHWRRANNLSQRAASEVFRQGGLDLPLSAIQQYEQGFRRPGKYAAKALEDFLHAHPRVDGPVYRRGRKPQPRPTD